MHHFYFILYLIFLKILIIYLTVPLLHFLSPSISISFLVLNFITFLIILSFHFQYDLFPFFISSLPFSLIFTQYNLSNHHLILNHSHVIYLSMFMCPFFLIYSLPYFYEDLLNYFLFKFVVIFIYFVDLLFLFFFILTF